MKFNAYTLFAVILLVAVAGFVLHDAKLTGFTGSAVAGKPMKKVLINPKLGVDPVMLKEKVNVRYDFDDKFSAEIAVSDIAELSQDAYIEELKIYEIAEMPMEVICNDGICGPGEPKTCPRDCPKVTKRTCYPLDNPYYGQTPWNIDLVNGPADAHNSIKVAVLDTGVQRDHPDLKFVVKECKTFLGEELEGTCVDGHSHGTHVIGTVAADAGKRNLGIYGVAPGVKISAYKVCDDYGNCWEDDIAWAIAFAAKKNIEIVSMSLGGFTPSPLMKEAIDYAVARGTLVVAAAGNSGPGYNTILYPAAYENVVAVGAVYLNKIPAYFSSRGINNNDGLIGFREVEFAAPGVSIYSTWNNGCYGWKSGTSMATPHVAAIAAVLWQGDGASTRAYLQSIAEDIYLPGEDTATGLGFLTIP